MFKIAVSGGCLIRRRFSGCDDARFLGVVDVLRGADVAFAHLEGTISDADDPEVYPAAEGGWTWIRAPKHFAEELKWAGFKIVSHASNHCMDYMYGGLYSTWNALNQAALPFAGTGMTLDASRAPAYLDVPGKRVALISSCSSAPNWSRAANPIREDRGRPGANQLRTHFEVDRPTMDSLKELARRMGWWTTEIGDDVLFSPSGLHNTITRFVGSEEPGIRLLADPDDVAANLRAIREAKKNADFIIFHIHNHEWNPEETLSQPAEFIRDLARQCIDAGADLFIGEGAHAQLRGIEIYNGKPAFYDPGDLFKDGNSKIRPLSEYYWLKGKNPKTGQWQAVTRDGEGYTDLDRLPTASNPPGGYNTGKVLAVMVPVCTYDRDGALQEIRLHPARHLKEEGDLFGLPGLETGERAREIIEYVAELSRPYGTKIEFVDGVGVVRP
jgi:poly-gamma-glutamate capsule biosynthesis protein CapA/YwtB (metallophosphatase superfamily)